MHIFICNVFAYFCKMKYRKNKPETNEMVTHKRWMGIGREIKIKVKFL